MKWQLVMATMVTISLQPIGVIDPAMIAFLKKEIGSIFGDVEVRPAAEAQ